MRAPLLFALSLSLLRCSLVQADTVILKKLEAAASQVKAKEYEKAIAKAQPLLEGLKLSTVEEIILAHKILGVSQCELGDQTKATEHFQALLTFSPTDTIDEFTTTKPCQTLFNDTRSEKLGQTAPATGPSAQPPASPSTRTGSPSSVSKSVPAEKGKWKLYVPFGVGQFRNGQRSKGLAFLATESAAAATAITTFILFKSEEGSNGTFAHPERASAYRTIYWTSLGIGASAAIWGVIDAVWTDKKRQKTAPVALDLRFGGPTLTATF